LLLEQVQASTVVRKLCRRLACRPLDRLRTAVFDRQDDLRSEELDRLAGADWPDLG
jgi:hypothetical protein